MTEKTQAGVPQSITRCCLKAAPEDKISNGRSIPPDWFCRDLYKKRHTPERKNTGVCPFGFFSESFFYESNTVKKRTRHCTHPHILIPDPYRLYESQHIQETICLALRSRNCGTTTPLLTYRQSLVTLPNNHKPHDYLETAPKYPKKSKNPLTMTLLQNAGTKLQPD